MDFPLLAFYLLLYSYSLNFKDNQNEQFVGLACITAADCLPSRVVHEREQKICSSCRQLRVCWRKGKRVRAMEFRVTENLLYIVFVLHSRVNRVLNKSVGKFKNIRVVWGSQICRLLNLARGVFRNIGLGGGGEGGGATLMLGYDIFYVTQRIRENSAPTAIP